jgi:hypothetical protein
MARDRSRLLALNIAAALSVVVSAAALDAWTTATAGQRTAPWCANLGGRDGGWDCGYYSFEQCMATARGLSGNCQPNPWVLDAPRPPPRRARR